MQKKLAMRHMSAGGLLLYDLSSSYFEGSTGPLAKRGTRPVSYRRSPMRGAVPLPCRCTRAM